MFKMECGRLPGPGAAEKFSEAARHERQRVAKALSVPAPRSTMWSASGAAFPLIRPCGWLDISVVTRVRG